MSFVIRYLVYMILSILTSVFAMLTVGYDAKALGVKKRTKFMVLTFFFPLITGIVYLCVRKKTDKIQPKMCDVCHTTVDTTTTFCPVCSNTTFTDYQIVNNADYKKKAKVFLIITIFLYVAANSLSSAFSGDLQKKIEKIFDNSSSISQYDENPFENFNEDEFEQYFEENFGE